MAPARHDPAARRRRLETRVLTLKRRVGIVSILGFGALFGLVTQHAVGSQKHKASRLVPSARPPATRSATSFFDANGPSYSFDDSGVRTELAQQQSQQQSQSPVQQQQQPSPVAQSSGS